MVEGLYGGQRVAVKVIDTGLMAVALLGEAGATAGGASSATGSSISAEAMAGLGLGLGGGSGGNTVGPERAMRALVATLAQEVEVLARCQHPNVVRLLAANLRWGTGVGTERQLCKAGRCCMCCTAHCCPAALHMLFGAIFGALVCAYFLTFFVTFRLVWLHDPYWSLYGGASHATLSRLLLFPGRIIFCYYFPATLIPSYAPPRPPRPLLVMELMDTSLPVP